MLLARQRSQLNSSPETHVVQSSRHPRFQLPIWVLLSKINLFRLKYLTYVRSVWNVAVLRCKTKVNTDLFEYPLCGFLFAFSSAGPVQVHNPGTVIFSLLSHFSGQVGPAVLSEKRADEESNEEEDESGCPVFHPTPSPSIHISKEERGSEAEDVFFPSQEQGKDYHVSKEEDLWSKICSGGHSGLLKRRIIINWKHKCGQEKMLQFLANCEMINFSFFPAG